MDGAYVGHIWNRVQHLVRIGYLTNHCDETGVVQTMQIQHNTFEGPRDGVSSVQQYGVASSPVAGANAVVLNIGGDNSSGIVIGTNDQRYRPTNMLPGETMLHDNTGQSVYIQNGVQIVITANNEVIITAPTITINATTGVVMNTPELKVTGDILDNSGTNSHTIAQMRSIFNNHEHSGVASGTANSGNPTTTQ